MRHSTSNKLAVGLLALTAACAAQAQVYKWVDANGRTHYSSSPEGSGTRKVDEVRTKVQAQTAAPVTVEPAWKKQEEEFRRRQEEQAKAAAKQKAGPGGKTPHPHFDLRRDQAETDASRCALARDVLNGSARRSGNRPTDANDRDIAQRDVQNFCK